MIQIKRSLILILLFLASIGSSASSDQESCEKVLQYIYKEVTLENLEESFKRTNQKFLLSLYQVQQNLRSTGTKSVEIEKIINTLRSIDPKLKRYVKSPGGLFSFMRQKEYLLQLSLKSILIAWKDVQQNRPNLFKGIPSEYLLDDWDMQTIALIDRVAKLQFSNFNLREKIQTLAKAMNRSKMNVLKGKPLYDKSLKNAFIQGEQELISSMSSITGELSEKFDSLCSPEQLNAILKEQNYICPIPKSHSDFNLLALQIKEFEDIMQMQEPGQITTPSTLPVENNLVVNLVDYQVNPNPNAVYCKRDPNLVSMIVLHHTDTPDSTSPLAINEYHLENSTDGDPWYMIGYNYMISNSYDGATPEAPAVIQGRSPDIRGAHAGGFTKKLSAKERRFYRKFNISCGNETIGFTASSALADLGPNGGISGNLISHGIAVIGNYSSRKWIKMGGLWVPINITSPEKELAPNTATINKIAELSCHLQKKNPRIKMIVPHQYFKATECPGILKDYIDLIAQKTQELGCHFNTALKKEKK